MGTLLRLSTRPAMCLRLEWLAVIYSAGGSGYVAVFAIDAYGDLTPAATSSPIGVSAFNGVAISE